MRKLLLAALAAAAIFATATPIDRAQAMTPAAPSQLGNAAGLEKAAWRCGWNGCVPRWHRYYRNYPYRYPYPYRFYVRPPLPVWGPGPWMRPWPGPWYGPRWGWGWRRPYWRW